MSGFIYPPNVYDVVSDRWGLKLHPNEEFLALPNKENFDKIINVIYHASFLTEERRRMWFRVIYLSPQELEEGIVENTNFIRSFKFDAPRTWNVSELIKLAPAADPTQVLIAVSLFNNELKIWGLLEAGSEWWELVRHEISSAHTPPNAFTISSKNPGQMTISRSGRILVALNQGKITSSAGLFDIKPIANSLRWGAHKFRTEVLASLQNEGEISYQEANLSGVEYSVFLERVLNRIRELFHGGTLIIIPDEINIDDEILKERAIIKYVCQFDALSLIVNKKVADILLTNSLTKISAEKNIGQNMFSEYSSRIYMREKAENEVKRAAWFISSLSAVDGAIIVTDKLRLLGFGAELIAVSPNFESVMVINDFEKNIGENRSIELFGTRHRSAFRFCASLENAVALIVSQDGDVRAAKRVCSDVFVWPNINLTSLGF